MVTAIVNNDPPSQVVYHYSICIYVKAIFDLGQMPRAYKDPTLNQQFLKSKRSYEPSGIGKPQPFEQSEPFFCSVTHICNIPNQAFLMQYTGNMSQAWVINSYAARQIVALKYHEIGNPVHSLYWCYYLDRTLSALFLRPFSLPEPQMSPAELVIPDKSLPHMPLIRILLELVRIQGDLSNCGKADSTHQILANHSKLQDKMETIKSSLQSTRQSVDDFLSCNWVAAEFCYYAIQVDILHSRLKFSFSPLAHKECVSYARKSLRALHHLQKNPSKSPGLVDPYPTFLTWTIFLYPLSPFFVLFCNIIRELDQNDYNLIQEITQSLAPFVASPYISKLLRLLGSLQKICTPLIQAKERLGPKTRVAPWYPSMTGVLPNTSAPIDDSSYPINFTSYSDSVPPAMPQMQAQAPGDQVYPPTDELMWHLFNRQLSMECFQKDFVSLDTNVNANF
ncbi:hypothetical protein N7532_005842 [Penicillium argentinense]|uniref:Xylanolytic transcriptional activator regulatory domain-containing protein n=1 Tax=Penicillium argentinense TaxID=1131581 RepID=A0A9W9FES2_9EURO|nr:uncharacterized protein N7532_005842 [Penicillium argentinense]KAJ5098841.1 hypothetical protein N7532_005842 [Penicillium argentinense]